MFSVVIIGSTVVLLVLALWGIAVEHDRAQASLPLRRCLERMGAELDPITIDIGVAFRAFGVSAVRAARAFREFNTTWQDELRRNPELARQLAELDAIIENRRSGGSRMA